MHEWLLWALFASTPEHASPEWDEEIEEYMQVVEATLDRKLEPGRAPGVKSLRLSFDPIAMVHRPLIWYSVSAVNYIVVTLLTASSDCRISGCPYIRAPTFVGVSALRSPHMVAYLSPTAVINPVL